MFHVVVSRT